MKINNKKIIVSTLALAMGAALAGSISGSVAWYQYSTRAAAKIQGISAGVTGDLALSIDGGAYARSAVTATTYEFMPISASGTAGSALSYYGHPVYQFASLPALSLLPTLTSPQVYYKDYQIKFRFYESETTDAADAVNEEGTLIDDKDVYLSQFSITGDLADAVRVELFNEDGDKFFLSNVAAGDTYETHGELDLGGADGSDTMAIDLSDTGSPIDYNNGGNEEYETQAHTEVLATITDAYHISGAKMAVTDDSTILTVRVWLEGWTQFSSGTSMWDLDTTLGEDFQVNMQFICEANK